MISIRKYLSSDNEAERALMHVVRILIEGIGRHAVAGDAEDCARFQSGIRDVSAALNDTITPEGLLVQAGCVLKGLEDHNRSVSRHRQLQTSELQNMVRMLTATVGTISAASKVNIRTLGDIEKKIATTSGLDDVRTMKTRLSDCLTDIRKEAERQHTENEEKIEELRRSLTRVQERSSGARETLVSDTITGLPLRAQAEATLAESDSGGSPSYAAVMVIDQLQTLNARFGRDSGDEVLMTFAQSLIKELRPEDRLFRWSGPTLLAVLQRRTGLEMTRSEISRVMERKVEHSIETPTRSVLIPISVRWCLFPTTAAPRLLFQRIDNFAARLAQPGS